MSKVAITSSRVRVPSTAVCAMSLLSLLVSSAHARAQDVSSMQQISAAVNGALAQQAAGQFQPATQALEQTLGWCNGTLFRADCRRVVLYSLGYVHQVEARRDPPNQERLLQSAATHYQALLNEQPGYDQAIYNLALVYRDMGPHEWQEPFLRDAPRADPARRATYQTLLGDYYQDRRMWDQAIAVYRLAMQANDDDVAPRRGLLDVYRAVAPARNQELLALATQWAQRFPDLASEAYELIVRSAFGAPDRPAPDLKVEQALVRWVSQLAHQRRIDAAALAGIPTSWVPAGDLRRYINSPYETPSFSNWWMRDDDRRKVLAEVAYALGQRKLADGQADRAEACWNAGKAMLPPIFEQILNLKRELAMLWFRRPELDPGGRKFEALERELFLEKGGVLGSGDLEAGQRYHTALGLIYFEKKVWRSPRTGWNAIDQLTWALDKAALRDTRESFYQPLPELKSLLAQSLEQAGDRTRAPALRRAEAEAFLDTDDLAAAAQASARATAGAGARPFAALIAQRQRVESLAANASDPAGVCERAALERALAPASGERRTATFTARQRFKLLADCSRVGPELRRNEYAADVFALAVQDSVPLVGIADLLRFERASVVVLGSLGVPTPEQHIEFEEKVSPGGSVRISLPTETRAGRIYIPREAVLAGQIARLVGVQRSPLRLRFVNGAVTIEDAPEGLFTPQLLQRIRGLPNVGSVEVTTRAGTRIRT